MTILGIETSCDETAAAIIQKKDTSLHLASNIVASSLTLHAQTGGVIPEVAAREQIKYILPVIKQALTEGLGSLDLSQNPPIDAIAVTYGPGLIGSLLVGVETAKTLSYLWNKPLIPINHMIGHIYANWIESPTITFPAIALVVSGGHTDLVLLKGHGDITLLGGTRDDAAGEAFDKIGRLLSLPYPAGPVIEQLATSGNPKRFHFPRPLTDTPNFEFSFSGLKTAVLREVQKLATLDSQTTADIARGVQDAIISVLVSKTLRAVETYQTPFLLLSGGVAANQTLKQAFEKEIEKRGLPCTLNVPSKKLCTDNAAMIAAAAAYTSVRADWKTLTANPELYFE